METNHELAAIYKKAQNNAKMYDRNVMKFNLFETQTKSRKKYKTLQKLI
jgi:hypothetical protein